MLSLSLQVTPATATFYEKTHENTELPVLEWRIIECCRGLGLVLG